MFDHRDYDFFVDENVPAGAVVGTVKATDLDPNVPNNKLTYAIIPDDGTFSIDPGTGLITTRKPLDRESRDLHELIAHVFDHGLERSRLELGYFDVLEPEENVTLTRLQTSPTVKSLFWSFLAGCYPINFLNSLT